jgi:hypothetical protein
VIPAGGVNPSLPDVRMRIVAITGDLLCRCNATRGRPYCLRGEPWTKPGSGSRGPARRRHLHGHRVPHRDEGVGFK